MRNILMASTLGIVMSAPGLARAATVEQHHVELAELKQLVGTLLARIEQLEQATAAAAQSPAAPAPAPDPALAKLEARVVAVEESNDRQTDQLAQGLASSNAMDWARNVKWKGDLRYRHEQFDVEGTTSDRVRHRIRARLGMEAKISSSLLAGFEIATADIFDPRSTNSTLDDASRRKEIGLNLAYIDWKPRDGMLVTIGKQKQPWFKAGNSLLVDGDINPEGVAVQYGGKTGPFAKAWGYWLDEFSSAADSNLVGGQLGYAFGGGLTLAAAYWDYGAIKDQPVLPFVGAPAGNSSYTASGSCLSSPTAVTRCYTFDYNIVAVDAQWSGKVGAMPVMLFGGYLENMDPETLNTGFDIGFLLGKASDPGSWEFGALYQDVERDAQFALFLDSDFADGLTQGKGIQLQGVWAPVKNMTIKAAYFINDRNYDTPSEADYRRLQLDLNYKF